MPVLIALALAVFCFLAKKAGYKLIGNVLGVIAILTFIGWLASGPGEAILNWINNPSVDAPSIDINR